MWLINIRFLLLLICLHPLTSKAASVDPSLKWHQYPTDHFVIVYPHTLEKAAREIGPMAEDSYQRLSPALGSQSRGKIFIVVRDDVDQINGFAALLPQKYITLWVHPPIPGQVQFDARSRDTLHLILEHELTHIAQMDQRGGVFPVLQTIFGPVFSPNMYLPRSFLEGLAVYTETEFQEGRGRGTIFDMILRTDVVEGRVRPIDQTLIPTRQWPPGMIPYVYGYMFTDYLAKTYGPEKLKLLSEATGRRFPFFINGAFQKVFGKGVETLWKEWQATLPAVYGSYKRGSTDDAERLFVSGGWVEGMTLSPDSKKLYFYWRGKDNFPALAEFDIEKRRVKILSKGDFIGKIALPATGQKLYYAKIEPNRIFSSFADIYEYDLKKGREKRLTKGRRARDVAVDPEGKRLIYVRMNGGETGLEELDLATGVFAPLSSPADSALLHNPVFSPTGTSLVLLAQRPGIIDDLYFQDLKTGRWRKIGVAANWISDLSFAPDGRTIYFTTDRHGIPNIDRLSLESERQVTLTDTYSGAFGANSDGESVYFAHYTSDGFDLKRMRHAGEALARKAPRPERPIPERPSRDSSDAPSSRYHVMKQLLVPYLRLPVFGSDESGSQAGLFLAGGDILERHQYQMEFLYGFASGRPSYNILYWYDRWYPTLAFSTFDQADLFTQLFRDGSGNLTDYWERRRGVSLDVTFPLWRRTRRSLDFTTSYRYSFLNNLVSPALTPAPFAGHLSGLGGEVRFSHLEGGRYAISPERGFTVAASGNRDDSRLGSDLERTLVEGDVGVYLPALWNRHVLFLRGKSGASFGDAMPQGDFELGGNINLDLLTTQSTFIPVRGYPARSLSGSRFLMGQAEYRLPLWFIERGIRHYPFYTDNLSLVGFYDAASVWRPGAALPYRDSTGGEVQLTMILGHYFPLKFVLGFARGLRAGGESAVYYGLRGVW